VSKTLWVGLTGGIASGKSTVSKYLISLGIPVVDADAVAAEVLAPGSPGLQQVVSRFGPQFLNATGNLDRKKMADLVFKDRKALADLEAITHPLVQSRVRELRTQLEKQNAKIIFYDVPLLFEKNLQAQFDHIVLVSCTDDFQIQRMKSRNGIGETEARERLANQLPMSEKEKLAGIVIKNNGSLAELYSQVDTVLQKL
jgi:dephospho-CoA kinase